MGLVEALASVVRALNQARFKHLLIGGMAVSTWIEPRFTGDVDIIVLARRKDSPRLKAALIAAGLRPTALEMRLLFDRKFVRLDIRGQRVDVHVVSSPHDHTAMEQAVAMVQEGLTIRVARPEDLILFKLQAWRPIDRIDAVNLLKTSKSLDIKYVESWLDTIAEQTGFPIRDRWNEARKMAKEEP